VSEPILAGLNILVLEDEFLIAMEVEQICRDLGCESVIVRQNPGEVDEALLEEIDLAVLDVMAQGGTTVSLAGALSARSVPFVFSTGLSDGEDIFAMFPDVAVVTKPYASETLARALGEALARPATGAKAYAPADQA
jgi:DNA-binding response OmpR family regulator